MDEPLDEFDDWQFSDEKFKALQAQGMCGERQNNGKRCRNPITERFDLDPDRPGVIAIGACGTHVQTVAQRVKSNQSRVFGDRMNRYVQLENARLVRSLRALGFKVRKSRYRDGDLEISNPGEFLRTLEKLGVMDKFQIDMSIEPCLAKNQLKRYAEPCQEPKGHEGKHDNWEGSEWEEPPPPEQPPPCAFEPAVPGANLCKKCSKLEAEHVAQPEQSPSGSLTPTNS